MAITTAQRNAGAYQLLAQLAQDFPRHTDIIAWELLRVVKRGSALEKEVAKALLHDLFTVVFGENITITPAIKHRVRHHLMNICLNEHNGPEQLLQTDAIDPEVITVT